MMNLLRQRIRLGASLIALLAILPFFIIAQESGNVEMMNCWQGSQIQVSSVYLTCDSSGAYYYGKSAYRNSSTCKYGDTANVRMYLELQKDFTNDYLMVSIDAGVYGILSSAMEATGFCQIATLSTATTEGDATDDASSSSSVSYCPTTGFYEVKTSFVVSSFEVDKNFHYIPDLRIHFFNSTSIVGCVQTGTVATYGRATMHAAAGMMALGIGMLVLGTCFGLMLYLTYRRKKRLEREVQDGKLRHDFPYVRTTIQGRVVRPNENDGGSKKQSDKSHNPQPFNND